MSWEQTVVTPKAQRQLIVTASPIFSSGGACSHILLASHDVTARRAAEVALHESEERLAVIYNNVSEPVALIDVAPDGCRYVFVNPAWEAMTGVPKEQAAGKRLEEVLAEPAMLAVNGQIKECIASHAPIRRERQVELRTGLHNLITTFSPIFDAEDRCTRVVFLAVDVTAERQADAARKESEALLALVYETAADPLLLLNVEPEHHYRHVTVNSAFAQYVGIAREQIEGRLLEETYPPHVFDAMRGHLRDAELSGRVVRWEQPLELPGGARIGVNSCSPIADSDGRCSQLVIAIHDVTAERAAEAAHRKSERHLALQYAVAQELAAGKHLTEAAPHFLQTICEAMGWQCGGLWMVDRAANVLRYVAGWSAPDPNLMAFIDDSTDRTVAPGQGGPGRVWAGASMEWAHRVTAQGGLKRKGAGLLPGLKSALGLPVIVNQEVVGVLEFFNHDIPQPDAEFSQTLTAICAQISQVIQAEIKEAQLRQSQKMEAVGQLAGGVAHDFNNILAVIMAHGEFILEGLPKDHPAHVDAQTVLEAGQRAANLTRQLLAFSRKQVLQLQLVDLNELVTSLGKMLRRLIGENIEMHFVLEPVLGPLLADAGQLEQVLMNLVVNARDAMPNGGSISIETSNVVLDEAYTQTHHDVSPGPYVMLAVSDTGTGMDEATLARIYDPFFTTKPLGKRTGLGLSTVYGIVKQLNGSIYVYSEPGKGTSFKIYLPQARSEETEIAAPAEPAAVQRASETVLLVEDDTMVRRSAQRILEGAGYTVIAASGPDTAEALAQAHEGLIHLLLTDVVMPGMGGRDLWERFESVRPMPVLFMSGYTDDSITRQGILEGDLPFLPKPFDRKSLLAKVREVLQQVKSGQADKQ